MSTDHKGNVQNQILTEEHQGEINAKRVSLVSAATVYAVVNTTGGGGGGVTTVYQGPGGQAATPWDVVTTPTYLYYNQSSLISGYVWHGFATPGSNPTIASFKILREELDTQTLLFANGAATFGHAWSSSSLASISYS